MLDAKVNLKLWVKVKKDWRDSDYLIKILVIVRTRSNSIFYLVYLLFAGESKE